MDNGRWRRGAVSHGMLSLLALHTVNEYYRLPWKPLVTAGLLTANTLIYLRPSFLDSLLPFVDEVWFNPHLILKVPHFILKLEEFCKKKVAEKSKKATSTSQTNISDVSLNEKQQLEYLVVSLNEKLCSIYLSKLIVANENILEKKHDFYSTK
ncbi:hypothetical protein ERO13_A06G072800v2 [Gossypium hirsutum]|uniref:Uncharacterized protein isoform X1 n=5 Tax=Gossypium TaxID=3633 RepID=A0A1U8HU94_GOSHI|nr:uncharacterized protein LOC107887247 isoform X1 [Gossypium hirsutum]KAB2077080.1 hypothetical protein ES319_A06G079500v1 [Gossypium barbadense]TYH12715.1 hypothetical protein ES288_A06G089100v1 [Gossypium darwinii]TYI22185.1 hypothetical protein ES332_A06G086800v1 [Gossypium tomentosum]TYJ29596.1 hypothetical protein E1A91_A06G078700v1 [Gossypium mustelinum]KAG4194788.1 hypothetical protein ERO13_A06G072800v2 [Gossypium hirsutum]